MHYGICNLSIVPLRLEASNKSEMVSQILYGELFKVTEHRKEWSKVRLAYDSCEGWIDNNQFIPISKDEYKPLIKEQDLISKDLVEFVQDENQLLCAIPIGSSLKGLNLLKHKFDGNTCTGNLPKEQLIDIAFLFLNAPYLSGGRTPFGIDCSGFTQIVYKIGGYKLLRDASQQATQGEVLSFIEESEPGDLAFFDNNEGYIVHVGIILKDHHIIHAHGKVRIDRLDQSGIYNEDLRKHTHKLRVIKKLI